MPFVKHSNHYEAHKRVFESAKAKFINNYGSFDYMKAKTLLEGHHEIQMARITVMFECEPTTVRVVKDWFVGFFGLGVDLVSRHRAKIAQEQVEHEKRIKVMAKHYAMLVAIEKQLEALENDLSVAHQILA